MPNEEILDGAQAEIDSTWAKQTLGPYPDLDRDSWRFLRHPQTSSLLGDSQKYPLAVQQFRALSGSRGKTTGRRERSTGMPQEWVRKTAHFDGICAQIAFGTERKCSLASAAQT